MRLEPGSALQGMPAACMVLGHACSSTSTMTILCCGCQQSTAKTFVNADRTCACYLQPAMVLKLMEHDSQQMFQRITTVTHVHQGLPNDTVKVRCILLTSRQASSPAEAASAAAAWQCPLSHQCPWGWHTQMDCGPWDCHSYEGCGPWDRQDAVGLCLWRWGLRCCQA